jgi:hypothetical protein
VLGYFMLDDDRAAVLESQDQGEPRLEQQRDDQRGGGGCGDEPGPRSALLMHAAGHSLSHVILAMDSIMNTLQRTICQINPNRTRCSV